MFNLLINEELLIRPIKSNKGYSLSKDKDCTINHPDLKDRRL